MNNPEDANAELGEQLTEIIREAVTLGLPKDEAATLCYGCGLDSKQVLNGLDT